jgi:hypothetical protein
MSVVGTSQPWQLPRRTAGHGSKADAGAQPLTERDSGSPNSNRGSNSVVATGAPRQRGCPAWVVLGHFAGGRDGRCRPGASAPLPFAHPGKSCSLIPELPSGTCRSPSLAAAPMPSASISLSSVLNFPAAGGRIRPAASTIGILGNVGISSRHRSCRGGAAAVQVAEH